MKRFTLSIFLILLNQTPHLLSVFDWQFERPTDEDGLPVGLVVHTASSINQSQSTSSETFGYGHIYGGSQQKSKMNNKKKPINGCIELAQSTKRPNRGECGKIITRKAAKVKKIDSLTSLLEKKFIQASEVSTAAPHNRRKKAARIAAATEYLEQWLNLEEVVKD